MILKSVYHKWSPFWSCESRSFEQTLLPQPLGAPHEIWLAFEMFENVYNRRRTDDRGWLFYMLNNLLTYLLTLGELNGDRCMAEHETNNPPLKTSLRPQQHHWLFFSHLILFSVYFHSQKCNVDFLFCLPKNTKMQYANWLKEIRTFIGLEIIAKRGIIGLSYNTSVGLYETVDFWHFLTFWPIHKK